MKCSSSFYSIADDGWWTTTGSWNNSSNKKNGALLTTRRDIERWNQPMQNVYPTSSKYRNTSTGNSFIYIYLLPYILTADCGSAKKCGQIFLLLKKGGWPFLLMVKKKTFRRPGHCIFLCTPSARYSQTIGCGRKKKKGEGNDIIAKAWDV